MHFIGLFFSNNWYGQYFRVLYTIFVRKEEDDYEILPNSESWLVSEEIYWLVFKKFQPLKGVQNDVLNLKSSS